MYQTGRQASIIKHQFPVALKLLYYKSLPRYTYTHGSLIHEVLLIHDLSCSNQLDYVFFIKKCASSNSERHTEKSQAMGVVTGYINFATKKSHYWLGYYKLHHGE